MAKESKSRSASRPRKSAARKPSAAPRKPKQKLKRVHRRLYSEFRPDSSGVSPLKSMRFTHLQRLQLLRWVLYIGVCILALVLQDSIMSRVTLFGATTDLAVGAMLLITVIEGSEIGSVFILLASIVFYFSGSAPGPYCVAMLTILGLLTTLFRQKVWHRSPGSIIFCAGLAAVAYELGLYIMGLFLGLTNWYRVLRFLFTGLYTAAAMIPMYYLIYRIGLIGGNTWKE